MEDLQADASHVLSSHQTQKLEEKEKDLENQNALCREQIVKMQEQAKWFICPFICSKNKLI